MAVVTCPKCTSGLRVPDGSTAAVRCPKCTTVFQPPKPKPAAGFEVVEDAPPRPAAPPPQKKAFSLDDAVRTADTPPRRDDRDDDRGRRRRDDDRDDRPRDRRDDDDRDRRRRDDRDDDYDDDRDWDRDREKPRKGSKFGVARPGTLLVLISLGVYLGTMALFLLFALIGWMGADIPNGLISVLGVLGLGGWVVALVGLGMTIAGPARSRGLAIATTVVSVIHLVLAIAVANQHTGLDGAMRWGDLITTLPRLDALIAELVYNSKGFDSYLLGLFAGVFELARLVLLGLLLGSLAGVAKDHRAAGLAKFGWIAAPSAAGIAMLVVVLVAVLARSATESAIRNLQQPQGPIFAQNYNEFQQRQVAERQRIESVLRAARNWTTAGVVLVYLLHTGTLILPGLAALGVYQSMGRRR